MSQMEKNEVVPSEKPAQSDACASVSWKQRFAAAVQVPKDVWIRAVLLFATLCAIKLLMVFSLRKSLYEVHWRVGGEPFSWRNTAAFYVFAVLVGVHLWRFADRCVEDGVRMVRAANASVLLVGSLFILLTFHEGDKNHLYAALHGILGWKDLGWYLITDLFFRMPWLAAWIAVYGCLYFGFSRAGRERFSLRITAVFAALYVALSLQDLIAYHDALIIIDCLGIACLFPIRGNARLTAIGIGFPLAFGASFYLLFACFSPRLMSFRAVPEFAVILLVGVALFSGLSVFAWRRGFFAVWSRMLPFAFTAFLLLVNTNYPMAENYRNLLDTGLLLPRYFLGELCIAAFLLVIGTMFWKWRSGGSLWWLDVIGLVLVTVALADLRLVQVMGTRLDWDVMSLAFGETPKMMWRMAKPYLPGLAVGLVFIGGLYYSMITWRIRVAHRREAAVPIRTSTSSQFVVVAFILLGISGIWWARSDKAEGQTIVRLTQTSPLLRTAAAPLMDPGTFLEVRRQQGLENSASQRTSIIHENDLNVLLIFQESTYNKHLSLFGGTEETQPELSRYKDRMEVFPNFFSNYAGSIHARFAAFTGLYPVRDYNAFTTERVPVKSLFEALNEKGYACSMFYSSFFDYTGFRDFLRGRGIEGMYDADTMPGQRKTEPVSWGLHEDETLEAIRQQIKNYAAEKRKFFLTYVPAAPHNPFDGTPQRFRKYKKEIMGDFTPLYRNELLYMDWVIASIIDQLKESGLLGKTIVVITADHGEMLGANGDPVGHGWAATPDLQNVPLIIMNPDRAGYRINDTIGSQVDLLPTILDLVGIPLPEHQLYEGMSLYSSDLDTNRMIYVNSFQQYGIIQGSRYIHGNRESEAGKTAGNSWDVFAITNQGARTIFSPLDPPITNSASMLSFDQFQENLIKNYSKYCEMLPSATAPQ